MFIASIYLWKAEPNYVATTSILVDLKTDPLLSALAPALGSAGFLATQVEVIKSDRLASRVVRMMGLEKSQRAIEKWREKTEGKLPLETFYAQFLQESLKAEASRQGSQILTLTFAANDPEFAATAANSFAKAYLDLSTELRTSPARKT